MKGGRRWGVLWGEAIHSPPKGTHMITIDQSHIDALVTKADVPAAAVPGVTCSTLNSAIQVLTAIQNTTSNAWVKMGIGIAVAALNAYKSVHGCP